MSEINKKKRVSPFMSEFSPNNPYGFNYIEHPQSTKVFYKYNQIQKHVITGEEDTSLVTKNSIGMVVGIAAALGSSLALGFGLKHLTKKINLNVYNHVSDYQHIYMSFIAAASLTASYAYFTDVYITQVCLPFIEKYKNEAVSHGFEDYEISATKEDDMPVLQRFKLYFI